MHDFISTSRHLLGVSFVRSLKPNLCTAQTTQNTTQNNCIISNAQNTTALQPNVYLAANHRLLVTNKGQSACRKAHNCHRQLLTPQSVSAFLLYMVQISNVQRIFSWYVFHNMYEIVQSKSEVRKKETLSIKWFIPS